MGFPPPTELFQLGAGAEFLAFIQGHTVISASNAPTGD